MPTCVPQSLMWWKCTATEMRLRNTSSNKRSVWTILANLKGAYTLATTKTLVTSMVSYSVSRVVRCSAELPQEAHSAPRLAVNHGHPMRDMAMSSQDYALSKMSGLRRTSSENAGVEHDPRARCLLTDLRTLLSNTPAPATGPRVCLEPSALDTRKPSIYPPVNQANLRPSESIRGDLMIVLLVISLVSHLPLSET